MADLNEMPSKSFTKSVADQFQAAMLNETPGALMLSVSGDELFVLVSYEGKIRFAFPITLTRAMAKLITEAVPITDKIIERLESQATQTPGETR